MSQHQVAGPFVFYWIDMQFSNRRANTHPNVLSIQFNWYLGLQSYCSCFLQVGGYLHECNLYWRSRYSRKFQPSSRVSLVTNQPLSVSLWHFLFIFQNPCLTHCLLLFQITVDSASQAFHLATSTIQRVDWWKRPKCPKSISQTLLVFSRVMSMDCAMYKNMMNWNWKL